MVVNDRVNDSFRNLKSGVPDEQRILPQQFTSCRLQEQYGLARGGRKRESAGK
jgi:hypothetical protein